MRVIKTVEKRRRLSLLVLDDREVEVDTETLLDFHLSAGSEISEKKLEELIRASADRRAYENALYILEYRSHSDKEIRIKLRQKGHSPEAVENTVKLLNEQHLLNDYDFACQLAEELLTRKKYGKRRVYDELMKRGIDRGTAQDIIENMAYCPDEGIEAVINKRFNPLPTDQSGIRRMIAALTRLGYSYGEIKNVLSKISDNDYCED